MGIKNRVLDTAAKKFGHDTWNLDTGFDAHVDTGFLQWIQRKRQENPSDQMRGPHEGRYITLMLKGLKPMAWIAKSELPHFQPYIKSGQIVDAGPLVFPDPNNAGAKITDHIVVLPGEEWRARELRKLMNNSERHESNPDLYDIKLGKLLGMSNTEIRYYIGR